MMSIERILLWVQFGLSALAAVSMLAAIVLGVIAEAKYRKLRKDYERLLEEVDHERVS